MPTKSTTQTTDMTTKNTQVNVVRAKLKRAPEAMKFISVGYLPLSEVRETYGKNINRVGGVTDKGVTEFIELVRDNDYLPEHHEPPVVTEIPMGDALRFDEHGVDQYRYALVAGHHRYHAHRGLELPLFYAQVVKFLPARGKTARSWMLIYQAQENSPSKKKYVRTVSTIADSINSIAEILNEESISDENLETEIESNMDMSEVKGVARRLKIKNGVLALRGLTDQTVQGVMEKDWRKMHKIHAETLNLDVDHIIHGAFVGTGDNSSHDYRTIGQVWRAISDDPTSVKSLQIVGNTTKANHTQIIKLRQKKARLLAEHAQEVLDRAAFLLGVPKSALLKLKKGNNLEAFSAIPQYWTPQLHQEDKEFAITGELIQP